MRDALVIFGIAAIVAVAFIVAWLVAVLRDGRRLRGMRHSTTAISPETLRRIVEEVEASRTSWHGAYGPDGDDDSTKTMPIVTGDVPGVEP